MNSTPPANQRWHRSLGRIKICSHCRQAFWHQGSICPNCQAELEEIKLSLLGLRGKIISFTYYPLTFETEEKISHLVQAVALVKLDLKFKQASYNLFLNLPFVYQTKIEKIAIGKKVEVTLARRLPTEPNRPIFYLPKVKLIQENKND